LLAQLGRALQFAGRTRDAEMKVTAALEMWPTDVALHALLTELLWQRGAGAAATSAIEKAVEDFPGDMKLRLVAADLLRNAVVPIAHWSCSSLALRSRRNLRHS
jgi:predicted Zn-dependent protease